MATIRRNSNGRRSRTVELAQGTFYTAAHYPDGRPHSFVIVLQGDKHDYRLEFDARDAAKIAKDFAGYVAHSETATRNKAA